MKRAFDIDDSYSYIPNILKIYFETLIATALH